jgi:hypothetical protein
MMFSMAGSERYIGGSTGGVPEEIFTPGFKGPLTGMSGAKLSCRTDTSSVVIASFDEDTAYFLACVLPEETDALHLDIKTKTADHPDRHPDLYASELVDRSLTYFHEQGFAINKLIGAWNKGDNYKAYRDYITKIILARDITDEDKKNAARNTWTGRLAQSLGFTEIERLEVENPKSIHVVFSKP